MGERWDVDFVSLAGNIWPVYFFLVGSIVSWSAVNEFTSWSALNPSADHFSVNLSAEPTVAVSIMLIRIFGIFLLSVVFFPSISLIWDFSRCVCQFFSVFDLLGSPLLLLICLSTVCYDRFVFPIARDDQFANWLSSICWPTDRCWLLCEWFPTVKAKNACVNAAAHEHHRIKVSISNSRRWARVDSCEGSQNRMDIAVRGECVNRCPADHMLAWCRSESVWHWAGHSRISP
jgi:hypothetical protein